MSVVIRFHEVGTPDVMKIEDESVGAPGLGQVRLSQEAIGVNFVDTLFRNGAFQAPLPFVTGVEGAGVIEAMGADVEGWSPGDRAAYFFAPGAYAATRLIAADALLPLPRDIESRTAAAILTKGLTAWMGLKDLHPLKAGERILVQGATGAVGGMLGQWARALGAEVIGVGSNGKRDRLLQVSDHALDSADPELTQKILAIAPGGVDVVYDFIGAATFASSQAAVRDGGDIVTIGSASGSPAIDRAEVARRDVKIIGGSTPNSVAGRAQAAADDVFDAFRSGVFGDPEVTIYRLAEAGRAHQDLAARRVRGAAVLIP